MAKFAYEVKTPQGVFDVESDTELTPAQAYSYATGQFARDAADSARGSGASPGSTGAARGLSGPAEAGPTGADLAAEDMPWFQKALVGVGGGLRRTYLGAKDLVGQGTEEEQQELKDWSENKGALGGWGTAGEITGELAATALPGGGAAAGTAKVLNKALPFLKKVGAAGGRTFNLGAAGRAGVEGAVSAGIQAPGEGESRLGNMAQGGALGAVLPLTLAGAAPVTNVIRRELSPGAKQSTLRAHRVLERTLGKDRMDSVASQLENANPSRLTRTTAATSQEPRLGALERGARSRGNVDFASHDRQVAREAWDALKDSTRSADELPLLEQGADDIMDEAKALFRTVPLGEPARRAAVKEIMDLRQTAEYAARPEVRKTIDNTIQALSAEKPTAEHLLQAWFAVDSSQSDTLKILKNVLQQRADDVTGGQFTNTMAGYQATMTDQGASRAAKGMRDAFMPDGTNVPTTSRSYGEVGTPSAIPALEEGPLRKALAAKASNMSPNEAGSVGSLADQLAAHEIYKPALSAGSTSPLKGGAEGTASAALNAGPLWRLRGALGSAFGALNARSQQALDQALLNPQDFLKMVALKKSLGRPLEPWESQLQGILASQGSAIGSASAGD